MSVVLHSDQAPLVRSQAEPAVPTAAAHSADLRDDLHLTSGRMHGAQVQYQGDILPCDTATLATVGPEQGGLAGLAGHADALDHLAGVVDGGLLDRSLLGYTGNPPISASRNSSLAPANITHIPWSSCGAALPVSQQCLIPSPKPWQTVGKT